jgi:hypothetical protein
MFYQPCNMAPKTKFMQDIRYMQNFILYFIVFEQKRISERGSYSKKCKSGSSLSPAIDTSHHGAGHRVLTAKILLLQVTSAACQTLFITTIKPLYYVHTMDPKISLYLLTRSLCLTWFVLNKEVHQYRKGPKLSVHINEVFIY